MGARQQKQARRKSTDHVVGRGQIWDIPGERTNPHHSHNHPNFSIQTKLINFDF